ncbi:MAG: DUF456 domain-containing protein [Calditrichaeota bacterium]|nr:DUF456 domain-containing protein [Calditrichota bacterium]RQV93524.1 MAG: DUF456 domain-containing protein [bacterium]RQW06438.1 MAG: DUF456 domain-containing protein [Calditrichota bacterium]
MIVGLAGTFLPMLPGIPLIYLAFFIYGFATDWTHFGANFMLLWGAVTLLMVLLDYYAGAIGARKYGASAAGVWGSILGGIVGIIFLGFLGILLGPFIGAFAGELLSGKTHRHAFRAGWGTFVGFIAGSLFKIMVGCIMIGSFIWKVFL